MGMGGGVWSDGASEGEHLALSSLVRENPDDLMERWTDGLGRMGGWMHGGREGVGNEWVAEWRSG